MLLSNISDSLTKNTFMLKSTSLKGNTNRAKEGYSQAKVHAEFRGVFFNPQDTTTAMNSSSYCYLSV